MKNTNINLPRLNFWVAEVIFILVVCILLLVNFPDDAPKIKIGLALIPVIGGVSYLGFLYGKSYTPNCQFNLMKSSVVIGIILITCIVIEAFLPLIESQDIEESHLVAIEIVLGLIVGYFVFHSVVLHIERVESIDNMNTTLNNLIKSIGVLEIIKSTDEYYAKLIGAIEIAQDSVSMIYLTNRSPQNLGSKSQEYWQWFQDYAQKRSRNVVVKRITSLDNDEKIDWITSKTNELAGIKNYGIRAYKPGKDFPPIMGVEIIDKKKVFLFGPHSKTPRWIYIENPDIAEGMAQYFDTLWSMLSDREIKGLGECFDTSDPSSEQKISERIIKIKNDNKE